MLPKPDKDFPYEPTLRKSTNWIFLLDWAKALDYALGWIMDRATERPLILSDVEGTGELQTLPLPVTLAKEPAIVRVVMREPPTVKAGMDIVAAAYKISYGPHSTTSVAVKVAQNAGATKSRFDVWIWP